MNGVMPFYDALSYKVDMDEFISLCSAMVNDGTCNGLVYLEGEQVRWLLDLTSVQWTKLEEVVEQSGEINLNMVIYYLISNKKNKQK